MPTGWGRARSVNASGSAVETAFAGIVFLKISLTLAMFFLRYSSTGSATVTIVTLLHRYCAY